MTPQDIQAKLDGSPFIRFLGLTCEEMDPGAGVIVMKMPMRPELERGASSGQLHGGPVASLIDTVADFAVVMKTGAGVPTINLRIDYLRPSTGTYLIGRALSRRVGRTMAVVDVDVLDDQGRLTAIGRGCFGVTAG